MGKGFRVVPRLERFSQCGSVTPHRLHLQRVPLSRADARHVLGGSLGSTITSRTAPELGSMSGVVV